MVLTFVLALADCGRETQTSRALVPVEQQMGSWEGTESQTLGLVSQSGSFRIRWQSRVLDGATQSDARFLLTVHSGVSGRPLREVVDQRGGGAGAVNFEDDPRPYNLMVESSGVAWTVTVDEVVLAPVAR